MIPPMLAHFLTSGTRFEWNEEYQTYLPVAGNWIQEVYGWPVPWTEYIKRTMVRLGVWEPQRAVAHAAEVVRGWVQVGVCVVWCRRSGRRPASEHERGQ